MEFATWDPVYEAIVRDFGYGREGDERARDVLADCCTPFDESRLSNLSSGTVAVCGAGPSLRRELSVARRADAVVAASTAAVVCRSEGVGVDCMVTDLDGRPDVAAQLTAEGTPVAVHAHGDNVPLLRETVPTLAGPWTLPTTQAAPAGPVRNFGGFTDGDRAAFLADHCGADRLVFPGWDLDDPDVAPEKARKLRWAERLLYWLERRRDERFDVLDGRRDAIDATALPV